MQLFPFLVDYIEPEAIQSFVLEVQSLYFVAKDAITDPSEHTEHLSALWTKMEAAIQNVRRIQWVLETFKPCAEDTLQMLINNLLALEHRVGIIIEQYSCLVPLLTDQLRYRASLSGTGTVGRPSYIITKEQLEVMRSYGLSWMDIAKALGETFKLLS